MAAGGKQRDTRDDRERARVYQARRAFHDGLSRRRTRDNLIAGIVGGILIVAVIGGQTAFFVAGPGAPVPTPSPTGSPLPSSSPATTPLPDDSPAATPAATPTSTR